MFGHNNAIAWTCIDLIPSAVRQFSKSEQFHEDGQVRLKHGIIDLILMLF
jgi:hypothetical protein